MDDDLIVRLETIGGELERRSLELEQSDRDTALMMQGLAVAMEAVRSLAGTVSRLDGLPGLGKGGD